MHESIRCLLLLHLVLFGQAAAPRVAAPSFPVRTNLDRLLADEDTDRNRRITVADRGNRWFELHDATDRPYLVEGLYELGNLVQTLGLAAAAGRDTERIDVQALSLPPLDWLSHQIRAHHWNALTRRLDDEGIQRASADPKIRAADGGLYVYVPHGDVDALRYYRDMAARRSARRMEVVRLPEHITPAFVRGLNTRPGLLALATAGAADGRLEPLPYVTPGGRFNEMYGWDSYFIALGLLADGRVEAARAMVDHFVYQVNHYGKILNANRTYYLTRSQPPFLTAMALAVYQRLPRDATSRDWLAGALRAAVREYETVWSAPPRLTGTGLSRHFGEGLGMPPEVDPHECTGVLAPGAERAELSVAEFARRYRTGEIQDPTLDEYFRHDRAMRESGHDTTNALVGRAADLVTVALNSLLYRYEADLAAAIEAEFNGRLALDDRRTTTSDEWSRRADRRRERMMELMWDARRDLFFDYDVVQRRRTDYVSATTLFPLWAGVPPTKVARRLAAAALRELEAPGGVLSSTRASRGPVTPRRPQRQWDYPFAWAPHQMLAWDGLDRYGRSDDAQRLMYRWLHMIGINAARHNGAIVEKYDAVRRTLEAGAEYGNVGRDFELVSSGGFGWTNASIQIGRNRLSPQLRKSMDRMIPPEWVFAPAPPAASTPAGAPARDAE